MRMHLDNYYFEKIKAGTKTIEVRLNDEKRRELKVGDIITFDNRKTNEKLDVRVSIACFIVLANPESIMFDSFHQ